MKLINKFNDQEYWKEMETKRFGISPLSITAQSCMGSIAIGLLLQLESYQAILPLCLVTALTMGANAITIAQTSMKSIMVMFLLVMIASVGGIIYFLLMK